MSNKFSTKRRMLTNLCQWCGAATDIDVAGVLYAAPSGQLACVAVSSNLLGNLELEQPQTREGPGQDRFQVDHPS